MGPTAALGLRSLLPIGGPLMASLGGGLFLNEFLSEGSRPGRENNDKEKTNREVKDYLRRTTQQ